MSYQIKDRLIIKEFKRMALEDGLTKLGSNRSYIKNINAEIERAERHKQPLALAMIDIDHFKDFNDTYGHEIGDQALQEAARCIVRAIRKIDGAYRYGGEEFVVILTNTTLDQAKVAGYRILEEFRNTLLSFKIDGEDKEVPIRVSIGLAQFKEGMDKNLELDKGKNSDEQECLNAKGLKIAADKELYVAKEGGRNCMAAKGDIISEEGIDIGKK